MLSVLPAGDGPGREELLPGHAQTDQEEDQRVHAVPPGRLRRLHGLARRSVAAARGKAAEPVLDSLFLPRVRMSSCRDVVRAGHASGVGM